MSATPTLREWLREGPFTLTMSSGYFAFYAHTGFFSVLEEAGLLPERVTGSSAGALVAGAWASGLTARGFQEELFRIERRDFWDPALGLGLLRGQLFQQRLAALLPAQTFEDCRVALAVSLYDLKTRRTVVRERGPLAIALRASCALPVLFQPVRIDGRPYIDGGVADRPGLAGATGSARVLYHHIESRSPWRRSQAVQIPSRAGMVSLSLRELPRSGPFKLELGRKALLVAQQKTREALDRPLTTSTLRL